MENKFYIKRNNNNQVAKVTKENILFLDPEFKDKIDELNLSSILRRIEEKDLGDFFQNSRFSKLPISAVLVKTFTLGTLYEVKDISVEDFLKLSLIKKFEFIISQKKLIWLNYLNKQELFDFLNYYNVDFNNTTAYTELKKFATTYIKQLQNYKSDELDEPDKDNHDQTFYETDIPTVLESLDNNTSKSSDENASLSNILVDLNTFQLNNNETDIVDNKRTVVQNKLFYKTENNFHLKDNYSKTNINFKMAGNHHFSPGIFNGTQDECVLEFFENFELMAKANGWDNEMKLVYLPLYLKGSAYKLFKILDSETKLSFEKIMLKFKENFASYSRSKMLRNKLRNRKLKAGESIGEFWIDMIFLINETNRMMPEWEKIDLILDALSPEYYNVIGMLKNNSLIELENNLKQLEYTKSRARELEEKVKLENDTFNSNFNNNFMQYNNDNYNNYGYRQGNSNGNYSGPRFNNYKPPFFHQQYNNNYNAQKFNNKNNNNHNNMNYNYRSNFNGYNNNYNRPNNVHNFSYNKVYPETNNIDHTMYNNDNNSNNMRMQNNNQKLQPNIQNKNYNENPPKTDIVCFGCGLPGHMRSSCTVSKNFK